MSHDHLRSAISELAQMAAAGFAHAKIGWVSSYDPDAYLVKVLLQPEGTETGWLPIVTAMAGAGFGVYYGPHADPGAGGDQAVIIFQEGDATSGICIGFLPNDIETPPHVATGEIHLKAKGSTAKVIMKPDGTIASAGAWTHTGTLHVTDEVTADKSVTATVDVVGAGKSLKGHKHLGITTGSGVSGIPQ